MDGLLIVAAWVCVGGSNNSVVKPQLVHVPSPFFNSRQFASEASTPLDAEPRNSSLGGHACWDCCVLASEANCLLLKKGEGTRTS